jgi:hypothetical protein
MLRLLKLSAYLLFGYFLYEAIIGIGQSSSSKPAKAAPPVSRGNLKSVDVDDSTGAHRTQKVGRGVIS